VDFIEYAVEMGSFAKLNKDWPKHVKVYGEGIL
jgi:hypothetical protein